MSSKSLDIDVTFHKIKFLVYGVTYAAWGYISYYLITEREPYYERVILGAMFFAYGLMCQKFANKYGFKANQYVSQFIDIIVALHYYSLMVRSFSWGEQYFIAYIFGSLVVMFATGFSTRGIPELISWSFINFTTSILISFKISFIHPFLFIMFVTTITLYVVVIGVNSAKLLDSLVENTEKRKAILSNMLEGVVVQNSTGKVIEYNHSALNILNVNESELMKNIYLEHNRSFNFEGDEVEKNFSSIFAFKAGKVSSGNLIYFKVNDVVTWVKISWSMFNLKGESFYLTTLEDVTESILNNIQLESQKEIANHKSKLASLGELAAGVGHEINNPLAIISGQSQLLRKMLLKGSDIDACLTRIDKVGLAVSRISTIVKGLRTFSRADKAEVSYFDLKITLEESLEMFNEMFSSEGIEIFSNIDEELWVKANKGRVLQVFINLLNNAKDALDNSSKKVIEVVATKNIDSISLSIKDYGHGISEEYMQLIFQPFFTTKEVDKGTGIGLALANSIIKEHGGEIEVNSEFGMWTEFSITLPLSTKVEVEMWQNQKDILIKNEKSNLGLIPKISGTVMVVDDEEDVRDIISEMLAEYDINVIQASSAYEAVEYLKDKSKNIELVISDIKMPGMDGIELLKNIRNNNYKGKFYFITGGVNIDVSDYNHLIDGVFAKPFEDVELLSMFS